jgi:hypothetical protein
LEKIYYVEVVGNEIKPFINLNPEKIISKKVDAIEITGIFLEGNSNTSFELEGMGEVRLIKQDLKDFCYDYGELKRFLLGDDIDIHEDIEDEDLLD